MKAEVSPAMRLSVPVPRAAAVLLCVGPGVRGPGAAVQQWRHRHAQHRPQPTLLSMRATRAVSQVTRTYAASGSISTGLPITSVGLTPMESRTGGKR